MSLSPLLLSLSLLLLTTATLTTSSPPSPPSLTAYDLIQSYDFPVGILPNGVTGYELNNETGEFKLYLGQTCKFDIDSYELEYKSTVSGIISRDRLTNLKGVSVKIFLFWLSIVEVVKEGDEFQFSVGIASANFPLDGFEESPTCGCGFDCDGVTDCDGTVLLNLDDLGE